MEFLIRPLEWHQVTPSSPERPPPTIRGEIRIILCEERFSCAKRGAHLPHSSAAAAAEDPCSSRQAHPWSSTRVVPTTHQPGSRSYVHAEARSRSRRGVPSANSLAGFALQRGEWNARLPIRNSQQQQEEKGAKMQFPTARALQQHPPPPHPCQSLSEQQHIVQSVAVPSSVHSPDPLVSPKPRHALASRSTLFRNSAVGSLRSRGSGGGKQLDGKAAAAAGRISCSPLCALAMDDVVSRAGESEGSGGGQPWTPISQTAAWNDLKEHVKAIEKTHLRFLLHDEERCEALIKEHDGVLIDFTRQRVTGVTLEKLLALADTAKLKSKIDQMFGGVHINSTEDRPVLHTALRAPRDEVIGADGKNVVPEVWEVLDKIETFSNQVRSGEWVGATGRPLTDVVAIGIGGSFLGPLFVHTAFRTEQHCADASHGRKLRFLANVDPIDVSRALSGLHQETTLVVVVSKTFTTSETMLNARTVRTWITSALGEEAVSKHMVAVSTNLKLVKEFGIDPANAFGFWDWVGGRYSVTSAVGVLPLALQYGFGHVVEFLKGAWSVDNHFRTAPLAENLPVLLGLLSIWNVSFLGCPSRAILPYCQALQKLAPHIQQVSMESNGKGVSIEGHPLPYGTGEVDFGEPGTNGQHSFYQLIHQGRIVPCEFIGIIKSQQSVYLKGEQVSNHDELMCNFFAQADALAYGKTREECDAEGIPEDLIPHKMFTGNRPSLSILLPSLTPYTTGQLLSLYENRVAVQGWIWGINSFDQWGVELGKSLAKQVRSQMAAARTRSKPLYGFNYSTTTLLTRYLEGKTQLLYPEPHDVFPSDILPGKEK